MSDETEKPKITSYEVKAHKLIQEEPWPGEMYQNVQQLPEEAPQLQIQKAELAKENNIQKPTVEE